MKFLALIAAAVAMTAEDLTEMATPKAALVKAELKKFGAKMKTLVAVMKKLDAEDKKITKAFFKKHAPKVKGWIAQRKAMKKLFKKTLKNAASTLKKAGIPAQVKTLKAMDRRLAATVKRDVKAFFVEGKKLDTLRKKIAERRVGVPAKEAAVAAKRAAKAIFA